MRKATIDEQFEEQGKKDKAKVLAVWMAKQVLLSVHPDSASIVIHSHKERDDGKVFDRYYEIQVGPAKKFVANQLRDLERVPPSAGIWHGELQGDEWFEEMPAHGEQIRKLTFGT